MVGRSGLELLSDPFLDAHCVGERRYRLSGPSPISVRDQVLRGATVIRRLLDSKEVAAGDKIIVLGAGVAGASSAITAAREGLRATLVERLKLPFSTQRYAWSRFIDPTQYDWPVDHFGTAKLPWDDAHGRLPIKLRAGPAPVLAIDWHQQLMDAQRDYGDLLEVEYEIDWTTDPELLSRPGITRPLLQIQLGRLGVRKADVVIDTTGFGTERCYFPRKGRKIYEGQPFWGPDRFARLAPEIRSVLISGGGDGALQDYIRVVTRLDRPVEVAREANLAPDILYEIHSAEDRAHRGRVWAMTPEYGHAHKPHEAPYLEELDRAHSAAASRALNREAVRQGLDRLIRLPPIPVTLVYGDPYLVCYYGLNRFLTHLLSQYIDSKFGGKLGHPKTTRFSECEIAAIERVASAKPHDCIKERDGIPRAAGEYNTDEVLTKHDCFGIPHKVSFSCTGGGASAPAASEFDVMILRHGVKAGPGLPVPRPRQMLFFHAP